MRKMYDGKSNTKGLRNAQKYSNTKECNCLVFSYIKQSSSVIVDKFRCLCASRSEHFQYPFGRQKLTAFKSHVRGDVLGSLPECLDDSPAAVNLQR